MAAQRFLLFPLSTRNSSLLLTRSRTPFLLSQRSASTGSTTGGSLTKFLGLTALGVGCTVGVIELVPGARGKVEQYLPGFSRRYERTKTKTIETFEDIVLNVSTAIGKVKSRFESKSPPNTPFKPDQSKATPNPVTKDSLKQPEQVIGKETAPLKEGTRTDDSPSLSHTASEKEGMGDQKSEVIVSTPPSSITVEETSGVELTEMELKAINDYSSSEEDLTKAMDSFSLTAKDIKSVQKDLVDTIKSSSQSLEYSFNKPGSIQEATTAVTAAKEQISSMEQNYSEHLISFTAKKEALEKAIRQADKDGVEMKVEEAKQFLNSLATEVEESDKAVIEARKDIEQFETQLAQQKREPDLNEKQIPTAESSEAFKELQNMFTVSQEQINRMKKRIEELEGRDQEMINNALKLQEEEIENITEARVQADLEKVKAEHREELKNQANAYELQYEAKLRDHITRQVLAQKEEQERLLSSQAYDLNHKWTESMTRELTAKDERHQIELAKAKAHVDAVDSMVHSMTDVSSEVRKQENLRAACEALTLALLHASREEGPDDYYSFKTEIQALREAAEGNTFIEHILTGLPQDATGKGVQPLAALHERFNRVSTICRRVALVPEEGGGLGTHIVSAVNSFLTFNSVSSKSVTMDTPLESMNTYVLLNQANMYMQKGDLEMALRYMNQLRGEPQRVAKDWMYDARIYQSTEQAIKVITQHVAASSISLL